MEYGCFIFQQGFEMVTFGCLKIVDLLGFMYFLDVVGGWLGIRAKRHVFLTFVLTNLKLVMHR